MDSGLSKLWTSLRRLADPTSPPSERLVDCGPGADVVYADRRDLRATRFRDCEVVTPGVAPDEGDPDRGVLRIGGAGSDTLTGTERNDKLLGAWRYFHDAITANKE